MDDGSLGVGALKGPGCLKMPKFIAFLCPWGCMLQEMVLQALTFTQRTRYDYLDGEMGVPKLKLFLLFWRTLLWISNCSIPAIST